jgi:anion-transporting  ArsA/GET3 family ATPase
MYSFFERLKDTARLKSSKRTLLQTIESWKDLSQGIIDFMRDQRRTRCVLVTIPESLGVRLTERVVRDLQANGIATRDLVINHIVEEGDCDFHIRRREMQEHHIRALEDVYTQMSITKLYLSPYEIRGIERIREISERLFE